MWLKKKFLNGKKKKKMKDNTNSFILGLMHIIFFFLYCFVEIVLLQNFVDQFGMRKSGISV